MSTFGKAANDLEKVRVYLAPGDAVTYEFATFDEDVSGWTFKMDVVDTDKQGEEETLLELEEGDGLSVQNGAVSFDIGGEDTEDWDPDDSYVGVLKITGTSSDPKRTHRVRFLPQDYNMQ